MNDHSHAMLWFILLLGIMFTGTETCSPTLAGHSSKISDLERRVKKLEKKLDEENQRLDEENQRLESLIKQHEHLGRGQ